MKDEPLSGVLYTKTAAEAWTKLSERYEGKGKQTIAYLIGELFRNTLTDDSSLETQLNAMQQKASIIRSLGQPLDDALVAIAMVISLPPSYSTLRTILMSTNDKLTVDCVISQVLVKERSKKLSCGQTALAAKTGEKGKGKAVDKKKKGKCHYCKIPGHFKRDCRKKKADEGAKNTQTGEKDKDKEKPKDKNELSAKLVQVTSTDVTEHLELFMAHTGGKPSMHEWVVDSGASANMSCQRNWFTSFTPLVPPQPVIIGDGRSIQAIGKGRIELSTSLPCFSPCNDCERTASYIWG